MVGKDQRNRHSRRGSRRVNKELAEVATQVAQAAVDNEAAEEHGDCLQLDIAASLPDIWEQARKPAGAEVLDLGSMLPTIDEEKGLVTDSSKKSSEPAETPKTKSPAHLILSRLPTPSRSPKSVPDGTPKSQGGTPANRFGMVSAGSATPTPTAQSGIVRGPEPWGLTDPAAVPQSSPKCGYREWLQARGQQAMQRSLMPGVTNRPPTTVAPAATTPAPAQPLPPSPGPATLGTTVGTPTMFGGLATPTNNLHPPPAQTASWSVPNDFGMPQWFGSNTVDMQTLMNQQASMIHNCTQPAPIMLDSSSQGVQQLPMTPVACPPLPEASANSQGGMKTPGNDSWCQSDLMATLMGGLSLDKAAIAEQLRIATPDCYED